MSPKLINYFFGCCLVFSWNCRLDQEAVFHRLFIFIIIIILILFNHRFSAGSANQTTIKAGDRAEWQGGDGTVFIPPRGDVGRCDAGDEMR